MGEWLVSLEDSHELRLTVLAEDSLLTLCSLLLAPCDTANAQPKKAGTTSTAP